MGLRKMNGVRGGGRFCEGRTVNIPEDRRPDDGRSKSFFLVPRFFFRVKSLALGATAKRDNRLTTTTPPVLRRFASDHVDAGSGGGQGYAWKEYEIRSTRRQISRIERLAIVL